MSILLLGPHGQVGWELRRSLSTLGHISAPGRESAGGDLSQIGAVSDLVRQMEPRVIVNAAAYTAVDLAESAPEQATLVNAEAPGALARAARDVGALFVHFSTDYVFDGSGSIPWTETSPTGPLNVYGRTKLEGEQRVRESGCRHLIFRTSWVFAARGRNFLRTMLRLASEKDSLSVVDDQHGSPTSAELIADVTACAVRQALKGNSAEGVFHLVSSGYCSWHDFATVTIEKARQLGMAVRVPHGQITRCVTAQFPTPARRPRNSRMATGLVESTFDVKLPAWQDGVARAVEEIAGR